VSRLIGAPPGYVGFDQGGLLTDGVDQHPHCVLLLDEIEKAHPDLFNILLQVMDHGKLTDHNGKQVDFRNVILIMTTNAGARAGIGFTRNRSGKATRWKRSTGMFTPEFRNRLDAIISFAHLEFDTSARGRQVRDASSKRSSPTATSRSTVGAAQGWLASTVTTSRWARGRWRA
jgi:ATP-dependent Clp protease ATP-binding subunit ClpA